MGGMGSGGAGFIAELRRQARREDRRREQKRARRQARLAGVRALREHGPVQRTADVWPFACASLCGSCGALVVPSTEDRGDPMRRVVDTATSTRCTRCKSEGDTLIDLANRDMATALVDVERHDRKVHAQRRRVVGGPIAATLMLATLATLAFVSGAVPLVGATLAAATLHRGTVAARRWSARGETPTHARRWNHNPKPENASPQTTGSASGTPTHSPLTGRACIAYDVRVVWNGESPTDPRSIALHEQRTEGLRVGGVEASGAFLQLEPCRVDTQSVVHSPAACEYLATRGLQPSDGAFDYYETLIVEQDAVTLTRDTKQREAVTTA